MFVNMGDVEPNDGLQSTLVSGLFRKGSGKPEEGWLFGSGQQGDVLHGVNRTYSLEFQPILHTLGVKSLEEYAQNRLQKGETTNFLDLYGPGILEEPQSYTSITAVTLDTPEEDRVPKRNYNNVCLRLYYEV